MRRLKSFRWVLLGGVVVLFLCVLSFNEASHAAPGSGGQQPDVAERQRAEMIAQLKEINSELKTLIALRQSGALPGPSSQPNQQ